MSLPIQVLAVGFGLSFLSKGTKSCDFDFIGTSEVETKFLILEVSSSSIVWLMDQLLHL